MVSDKRLLIVAEVIEDDLLFGFIIGFTQSRNKAELIVNEHYEKAKTYRQSYLVMLKTIYRSYPIKEDNYMGGFCSISDGSLTITALEVDSSFNVLQLIAERQQRTSNYDYEQMDRLVNELSFTELSNPN